MLGSLKILQNAVYGLDIKTKDYDAQKAIQRKISELINIYKEQA